MSLIYTSGLAGSKCRGRESCDAEDELQDDRRLLKFHDAPGTPLAPSDDKASTSDMGGRLAQGMHRSRSDTMLWSIEHGRTPFSNIHSTTI